MIDRSIDRWIVRQINGSIDRYSRSPKVGSPIAAILKSNVSGIPALFVLNPVSNFWEFTILNPLYIKDPKRGNPQKGNYKRRL